MGKIIKLSNEVWNRILEIAKKRRIDISDKTVGEFLLELIETKPLDEKIPHLDLENVKRITLRYDGKCAICKRNLKAGDIAIWLISNRKVLCLECYYQTQNYQVEMILTEICPRLLKLDNELYCIQGEGKRHKLLSLRECEICKSLKAQNFHYVKIIKKQKKKKKAKKEEIDDLAIPESSREADYVTPAYF